MGGHYQLPFDFSFLQQEPVWDTVYIFVLIDQQDEYLTLISVICWFIHEFTSDSRSKRQGREKVEEGIYVTTSERVSNVWISETL